jgi:tRNA A37 threonylcarbamoyladenosine synthetase subunit TsaC/SUA5/YrdC
MRFEVRAEQLTAGGVLHTRHVETIVDTLVNGGGLALIPSDTCYSLAARPVGKRVSEKINQILHRKLQPISLAFDTVKRMDRWVQLTVDAARLLEYLTPGPLTVVCRVADDIEYPAIVDDVLAVPDRTIGVRIPDSHIERQLVTACAHPLTTVAVRTRDSASTAVTDFVLARQIVERGIEELGERVPLAIVEGHHTFSPAHSTVVRVPGRGDARYDVIREGALSIAELDHALDQPSEWERSLSRRGVRRR